MAHVAELLRSWISVACDKHLCIIDETNQKIKLETDIYIYIDPIYEALYNVA